MLKFHRGSSLIQKINSVLRLIPLNNKINAIYAKKKQQLPHNRSACSNRLLPLAYNRCGPRMLAAKLLKL
uniref:Uncharacterized protein n=1 Tax=Arundo donax TaxID=35708 RepID=A0A0A9FUR9_ARUDO